MAAPFLNPPPLRARAQFNSSHSNERPPARRARERDRKRSPPPRCFEERKGRRGGGELAGVCGQQPAAKSWPSVEKGVWRRGGRAIQVRRRLSLPSLGTPSPSTAAFGRGRRLLRRPDAPRGAFPTALVLAPGWVRLTHLPEVPSAVASLIMNPGVFFFSSPGLGGTHRSPAREAKLGAARCCLICAPVSSLARRNSEALLSRPLRRGARAPGQRKGT